ncbi:MAG: carbohydrate kinase family protein [Thermoguttaceae bacterium]
MTAVWDVLGLGCTAVDELLYVAAYPAADSKVPIRRQERHCGGLTATALVAAARLGSRCAFAGALGEDELSRFVLERFAEEKIDTQHVRRLPGAQPVHAFIIVDEQTKTRTILYSLAGVVGPAPGWPDEPIIRACRVLLVDHIGVPEMTRAARVARQAGIPVVADLESDADPGFEALLALVDHLIVSRTFAARLTGKDDPAQAAGSLRIPQRQVAVVTCGAEGCWYVAAEAPEQPQHQPAFPVEVVDTTGCGDVFHGAYASGLARGLGVAERIELATAAAALKATRPGGQAGIPTRPAVEAFLRLRKSGR